MINSNLLVTYISIPGTKLYLWSQSDTRSNTGSKALLPVSPFLSKPSTTYPEVSLAEYQFFYFLQGEPG